jgi:hypothetical protein
LLARGGVPNAAAGGIGVGGAAGLAGAQATIKTHVRNNHVPMRTGIDLDFIP